jgi:hypothetical protein
VGKFLQGGFQYGGAGLFGLPAGAWPAGFGDTRHLINQLFNYRPSRHAMQLRFLSGDISVQKAQARAPALRN